MNMDAINSAHTSQSSEYDLSYHSQELESHIGKTGNSLWKALGPQHKDRLYYKIIKSNGVKGVVLNWINSYALDKDEAIRDVLQLFVDLASYQHINLNTFLEHHEITEIVPHMENSLNSIISKTGKYLLKIRQKIYTKAHLKIEEFIVVLMSTAAADGILFDCYMIVQCVKFITYMAKSNSRPIRHTGVFLGLKVQSGLIRQSARITKKIQEYRDQLINETQESRASHLEKRLGTMLSRYDHTNKLIEILHRNVYTENLALLDSQLFTMRQDCVYEILNWILYFPDRYLQNNCIVYVTKAITDPHKLVRYTALKVLSSILDNYHVQLEKKLPKYIVAIAGRMQDIDYKNAILAIDSLTKMSTYTKIPHSVRDNIFQRLYSHHYPLAAACGRYLVQSIKLNVQDVKDKIELLDRLIHFEMVSNKEKNITGMHPMLVEAVFDALPVLQDINAYMGLLDRVQMDEIKREVFLNILTESVFEVYTGYSSVLRKCPRKGNVSEDKSAQLTKDLIVALPRLLDIYPLTTITPLLLIIQKYKVQGEGELAHLTVTNNNITDI